MRFFTKKYIYIYNFIVYFVRMNIMDEKVMEQCQKVGPISEGWFLNLSIPI